MMMFAGVSANELYVDVCRAVHRDGVPVSPRGMATTEVMGVHLRLTDPRRRLVDLPPARVINPAFAVAEALWILSGSDDPWIFQYNRALVRYADDGRLQGAYGPRMRRWHGRVDQLDAVRRLLIRDPDSRQAVIQLFDPERDTRGHRDVPCTLGYRFFVRCGWLHMHTMMRSQDVWLGFPYDIFAATSARTGGDRGQARVSAAATPGELGRALERWYDHLTAVSLGTARTAQHGDLPAQAIAWLLAEAGKRVVARARSFARVAGHTPARMRELSARRTSSSSPGVNEHVEFDHRLPGGRWRCSACRASSMSSTTCWPDTPAGRWSHRDRPRLPPTGRGRR